MRGREWREVRGGQWPTPALVCQSARRWFQRGHVIIKLTAVAEEAGKLGRGRLFIFHSSLNCQQHHKEFTYMHNMFTYNRPATFTVEPPNKGRSQLHPYQCTNNDVLYTCEHWATVGPHLWPWTPEWRCTGSGQEIVKTQLGGCGLEGGVVHPCPASLGPSSEVSSHGGRVELASVARRRTFVTLRLQGIFV